MKKVTSFVLVSALATSLAASQLHSYVGGTLDFLATPDVPGAEDGFGIGVRGGVKGFVPQMPQAGAMIETHKSLSGLNDGDLLSVATYATYDIHIPNTIVVVRPKFGLILPNLQDDANSRDFVFSSGIEGVLRITKELDINVGYTVIGEYINSYSIGVDFNF